MDKADPRQPGSAEPAESTSGRRMIITMGGLGLVCGVLIVLTFQLTFPIIERKKAEALEKAIFDVVPGATTKSAFVEENGKLVRSAGKDGTGTTYYACYDKSRKLVGVAVEASGQGFQDMLRIIYGYSPEAGSIVGFKVLESKETPGLGDKIQSDAAFRANFSALEVPLDTDKAVVSHPIELVKRGEKVNAWQIEAITGATISSRAVATILRKSTAETVPVIANNLGALQGDGQ